MERNIEKMTRERAIEILYQLPYQGEGVLDGKTIAALKLGTEALKAQRFKPDIDLQLQGKEAEKLLEQVKLLENQPKPDRPKLRICPHCGKELDDGTDG